MQDQDLQVTETGRDRTELHGTGTEAGRLLAGTGGSENEKLVPVQSSGLEQSTIILTTGPQLRTIQTATVCELADHSAS